MNLVNELIKGVRPAVRLRRRLRGPGRPSWSEEFETIVTVLRWSANASTLLPLALQRDAVNTPRPDTEVVQETAITAVDAGGVPGFWFTRPESDPERAILYLHGGGYSVGSVRMLRDLIARLCRDSGARVLALDYRLAPEHPFPAQLDDAIAAFLWLLAQGLAPQGLGIAGESAGAGLTLSTLLELRERGLGSPAAAALVSPWVDLEPAAASYRENRRWDFVTPRAIAAYTARFVPPSSLRHPLAAPIHAALHDLPPILIQVGQVESPRDEGISLARKIERAGGDVELEVWDDMIHAFHVFAPLLPEARQAIDKMGAHFRRHFARWSAVAPEQDGTDTLTPRVGSAQR